MRSGTPAVIEWWTSHGRIREREATQFDFHEPPFSACCKMWESYLTLPDSILLGSVLYPVVYSSSLIKYTNNTVPQRVERPACESDLLDTEAWNSLAGLILPVLGLSEGTSINLGVCSIQSSGIPCRSPSLKMDQLKRVLGRVHLRKWPNFKTT